MKLNVMTYNIQHGHVHQSNPGRIDLTAVGDVIREASPDLVGLNEVRGRGEHPDYTAQAETLAAYLGYHAYFGRSIYVGGNNPYGNAVLSKFPLRETKVYHIPDPVNGTDAGRFEHRSITRAAAEVEDGSLFALYTTHFGLSEAEQEHAVSTLCTLLADEPLPFVLMGDFNVQPDNPVLRPLDWLTCADELLGGAKSFPSHDPSVKIDYLYASPKVRFTKAEILPAVASDHCPILAEIVF